MFQLVIGIFLGVLLLFVILLLVTEVAATYPLRKQFDQMMLTPVTDQFEKKAGKRNNLKLLLLLLGCMLGFSIVVLFINDAPGKKEQPSLLRVQTISEPVKRTAKTLTNNAAGDSLFFTLQLKWEDGRMYGNNKVTFTRTSVLNITDWRYFLLDNDGFLIKELGFTLDSFVVITNPDDGAPGLLNRFNSGISVDEFHKIEKMEVALDRKVFPSPANKN